jgi:hypothetical protein
MSAASGGRRRELVLVTLAFVGLAVVFTYPLAFRLGSLSRADNGDGQFAIWNVAWVARALAVDPLNVFDANIFHPNRGTLAYSEANLGAGLVAMPVYWLTGSPYAAYNFVLLFSFVASGVAMYLLLRYLFHDELAAFIAAVAFAFCPYLFGHIPHVQLLMTAGMPLSMLAFHRFADHPTLTRGSLLGLAMAVQTVFCAYYGIFVLLMIGYAALFTAGVRHRLADRGYWTGLGAGAVVALAVIAPLVIPYFTFQRETGFERSLDAAREYAAQLRMYVASNAYAHSWMMRLAGASGELLFPGFFAVIFAGVGVVVARTADRRTREAAVLYGSIGVLALWLSAGPAGGLYGLLYNVVPGFTFLRAPSRMGVIVTFALVVIAAIGASALVARTTPRMRLVFGAVLTSLVVMELLPPIRWTPAPEVAPAYRVLAGLPKGPLLELPVYSHRFRFLRARYMLNSTAHWMPLVVAYSDHVPSSLADSVDDLADFPSHLAFKHVERDGIRYVLIHLAEYTRQREALDARLDAFGNYLRLLHADDRMLLYEVIGSP